MCFEIYLDNVHLVTLDDWCFSHNLFVFIDKLHDGSSKVEKINNMDGIYD